MESSFDVSEKHLTCFVFRGRRIEFSGPVEECVCSYCQGRIMG